MAVVSKESNVVHDLLIGGEHGRVNPVVVRIKADKVQVLLSLNLLLVLLHI